MFLGYLESLKLEEEEITFGYGAMDLCTNYLMLD